MRDVDHSQGIAIIHYYCCYPYYAELKKNNALLEKLERKKQESVETNDENL